MEETWKEITDVEARAEARAATAAAGTTATISGIKPGDKAITCSFIVIQQEEATTNKEGERIISWRVGDPTGSILLSTFGEIADAIKEADILRLTKGYCTRHRGRAVLYVGSTGTLERIGEFCMVYSLKPDMSRLEEEGGAGQQDAGEEEGQKLKQAGQSEEVKTNKKTKREGRRQEADGSVGQHMQRSQLSSTANNSGSKNDSDEPADGSKE